MRFTRWAAVLIAPWVADPDYEADPAPETRVTLTLDGQKAAEFKARGR